MISRTIQSIRLFLHRKEKFYGLTFYELGFIPRNKKLYHIALMHKSASQFTKSGTILNYERLEFLGDAILGAITAEILYKFFPQKAEGELTCLRSKIVSRESLNEIAIQMGLDKKVIAKSNISKNKHIYGDVFEAFIGAIYLDKGYVTTKRFIEKYIIPKYIDLQELVSVDKNYKSRLIEWSQKNKINLNISTDEISGRRSKFVCTISIDETTMGKGSGSSKKEAEQRSAEKAILKIQKEGQGNVDI